MENFDLNLDNYNLDDLLNLFRVNYNLDEEQMKKAKLIALRTHPDKSGLPKEVFMFFSEAYKVLLSIYKYKYRKEKEATQKDYVAYKDSEKTEMLGKLKKKSPHEFNRWFNDMFEKVKIKEDNDGYGDWFKSNKDIDNIKVNSASAMANAFEKKKKETSQLVVHKDIREVTYNMGTNLTNEKPEEYSTDIFSRLPYQDLRKAHTETVVPTTREDYLRKKKFSTVNSYIQHREKSMCETPSLAQSKKLMREKNIRSNKINTERAYNLLKHDEQVKNANNIWWSHLKQLGN